MFVSLSIAPTSFISPTPPQPQSHTWVDSQKQMQIYVIHLRDLAHTVVTFLGLACFIYVMISKFIHFPANAMICFAYMAEKNVHCAVISDFFICSSADGHLD